MLVAVVAGLLLLPTIPVYVYVSCRIVTDLEQRIIELESAGS